MYYIILITISFLYPGFPPFTDTNTPTQGAGQTKSPSLKSPKSTEAAPPRVRTRYDRARDATYVHIDVPLNVVGEGIAGEMVISFQLAYRGKAAGELSSAFLIVNSTADADKVRKFEAEKRVDLTADAYHYNYERIDYRSEAVASNTTLPNPRRLVKESVIVRLPLEDLSQIANSNSLEVKVGSVALVLKSSQLTDLRRALISPTLVR